MRLFGLIGYPLTHSFSKDYFGEKFKREAVEDCQYENFQLANIKELPKIIGDHPGLEALNEPFPIKNLFYRFWMKKMSW